MSFDNSLFDCDAGYFEYQPNLWLPGKLSPGNTYGYVSRKAVDAAIAADLKDSDVLFAGYMKTGIFHKKSNSNVCKSRNNGMEIR